MKTLDSPPGPDPDLDKLRRDLASAVSNGDGPMLDAHSIQRAARRRRSRLRAGAVVAGAAAVVACAAVAIPALTAGDGHAPNSVATSDNVRPMPDLVGMTLVDAKAALSALGFDDPAVMKDKGSDQLPGTVLHQQPSPGGDISRGDVILSVAAPAAPSGAAGASLTVVNDTNQTIWITAEGGWKSKVGIDQGESGNFASAEACRFTKLVAQNDGGVVVGVWANGCDGSTWHLN